MKYLDINTYYNCTWQEKLLTHEFIWLEPEPSKKHNIHNIYIHWVYLHYIRYGRTPKMFIYFVLSGSVPSQCVLFSFYSTFHTGVCLELRSTHANHVIKTAITIIIIPAEKLPSRHTCIKCLNAPSIWPLREMIRGIIKQGKQMPTYILQQCNGQKIVDSTFVMSWWYEWTWTWELCSGIGMDARTTSSFNIII